MWKCCQTSILLSFFQKNSYHIYKINRIKPMKFNFITEKQLTRTPRMNVKFSLKISLNSLEHPELLRLRTTRVGCPFLARDPSWQGNAKNEMRQRDWRRSKQKREYGKKLSGQETISPKGPSYCSGLPSHGVTPPWSIGRISSSSSIILPEGFLYRNRAFWTLFLLLGV